jgi:carbon storage regulator
MLVLTRKVGEQLVVPEIDLTFTILEVRGDRVRLGVAAPSDVQVHRREVWARIQADSSARSAGCSSPGM